MLSSHIIKAPPSLKKLSWFLNGVVVCLCVRTIFPLPCVCVFVSQKKKKKKTYPIMKAT